MRNQVTPEVGMGATVCYGSDRRPATIVEVIRYKSGLRKGQIRMLTLQFDDYTLVNGSAHDGSATYEYRRDPSGAITKAMRTASGAFRVDGWALVYVGERRAYHDPSF